MDTRKEELERKRQKLLELKKARQVREKQKAVQNELVDVPDFASGRFPKRNVHSKLSCSKIFAFDIGEAGETMHYTKYVQTDYIDSVIQAEADAESAECSTADDAMVVEAQGESVNPAETVDSTKSSARTLTLDERKIILNSPEFNNFFEKSAKLVERVVTHNLEYDSLQDYARSDSGFENGIWSASVRVAVDIPSAALNPVGSLDWSSFFPELLLSSHCSSQNDLLDSSAEAPGVNVYNIHVPGRPEYAFLADSPVSTACFSPQSPYIIYGGTFAGQLVQWDTRAKKRPVLSSSKLDGSSGHSFPIVGLQVSRDAASSQLVSAGSDGTVCIWQLDTLAKPLQKLELRSASAAGSFGVSRIAPIAISCLMSLPSMNSHVLVGAQHGGLHAVTKFDSPGVKAGVDTTIRFADGHSCHVTCLSSRADYFLSSSMDWSVKVWKPSSIFLAPSASGPPAKSSPTKPRSAPAFTVEPFYTLQAFSCPVMSASWSSQADNLFSTVDAAGTVQFWDVNTLETDTPIETFNLNCASASPNTSSWSKGKHSGMLAVGMTDGSISVLDVSKLSS